MIQNNMIFVTASNLGVGRVMIFIDGGYLRKYCKQHYTVGIEEIDYGKLATFLANHTVAPDQKKATVIRIFYYDAIPDEKDADKVTDENERKLTLQKIQEKQTELNELIAKIQDTDKLDIRFGHLVMSPKEDTRQKGVDSQIAIDMITKAFQGQYDYAVLLGGDADLIPIIEAVKHVGPNVTLAYFQESNYSDNLTHVADRRIVMSRQTMPNNGGGNHIIPQESLRETEN